jgi:hypothetical protein
MRNLFGLLKNKLIKGFWIFSIFSLIVSVTLLTPENGYAASEPNKSSEEIVQPFELTRPAETREEAYEEAAKLTEHPKELVKAQNEEEKAQEEVSKK